MSSNITKIAVMGTGVIGAGWIIRALAHNKKVVAFDKDIKLEKKLIKEKFVNKEYLNNVKKSVIKELNKAVRYAEKSPLPKIKNLKRNVYAL